MLMPLDLLVELLMFLLFMVKHLCWECGEKLSKEDEKMPKALCPLSVSLNCNLILLKSDVPEKEEEKTVISLLEFYSYLIDIIRCN